MNYQFQDENKTDNWKNIIKFIFRSGRTAITMQIKKNPFTNSTSKQQWSFSKSKRFVEPQTNTAGFYSNPSSLEKKSATFGFGKRISLAKKQKQSCDPGAYSVPSSFSNKKRGFSFGTGRDQSKFQNYLKMVGNQCSNAFYSLNDSSLHKRKGIIIKQRTVYPPNYFIPNEPQSIRLSQLPSPCSYKTIDDLGSKCVSSKKKNIGYHFSNAKRFSTSNFHQIYQAKNQTIGPGAYNDRTITADGDYILSNMRSSGRRTIFKGKRTTIFDKKSVIPGPGEYDVLGDFGQISFRQTIDSSNIDRSHHFRPRTARN